MAYRQDLYTFIVGQIRGGKTQEELSEKLNKLVQDCRNTGKKGELTLTVQIRPDKGDSGQYFVTPSIKTKSPEFAPGETIFWGTPEGNLQRTDPAQHELPLKVVDEQPKAPRFVDEPPQAIKTVS